MGCVSSKTGIIPTSDGDEKVYHDLYLEDRVLGEGEFGVVRMVHDMRRRADPTAEPLASKVLKKGFTFRDNTLYAPLKPEVLARECRILRELGGKCYNLRLEGVYEGSGTVYIVTEYCSGGEMMEYVTATYPDGIRTEDASRISYQLLSAVDHCARHGVIHRDIKPENVMFTHPVRGAEMRLIDYGSGTIDAPGGGQQPNGVAAKDGLETAPPSSSSDGPPLTHTTFAGSAFYISPEMFQRSYTHLTDVWSAGATLYVLVAGYPADELQKAFNMLQKSKNRDLRDLPHMPESMPDSYFEMLDSLLTYRHKRRRTAGEVLGCEFVQFHRHAEGGGEEGDDEEEEMEVAEGGLSLEDVAAAAAKGGGGTPGGSTGRGGSSRGGWKRTQSIVIEGSVRRHAEFLEYGKFERALSTLLATVLKPEELSGVIEALESRIIVNEMPPTESSHGAADSEVPGGGESSHGDVNGNGGGGAVEVLSNERKLQIVKVWELRTVLEELDMKEAAEMMSDLPNASNYPNFAYHIALLKQFAKNQTALEKRGGGPPSRAKNNHFDISSHSQDRAQSVHGGRVWDNLKGRQRKNRTLSGRQSSFGSDALNLSSHM